MAMKKIPKKSPRPTPVEASLVRASAQAMAYLQGDQAMQHAVRVTRVTAAEASAAPAPDVTPGDVRALRQRLGLSQPVFAQALNVSAATVQHWEQGHKRPSGAAKRLLEVVAEDPQIIVRRVGEVARADPKGRTSNR
jgi:putative transcriptional regulator